MQNWQKQSRKKILLPQQVKAWAEETKKAGKTIVTLNGSFDLLHAGHLHILYEASRQGDVFLVALNSDSSIHKYKSPDRPIIPLKYRIEMMAAIGFVHFVTWFDETDPIALLEKIKPDVHANGDEYGENCIEAPTVIQHGGRIHIVSKVPGLSSTQIIEKIKKT